MRTKIILSVFTLYVLSVCVSAQDSFFFTGRIYDDRHIPVAGVSITFRNAFTTQTDSNGVYTFENTIAVRKTVSPLQPRTSFTLNGSRLTCLLAQAEQVRIGIFDIRGRQIQSLTPGTLQAGYHMLMLPLGREHGSSMPYVVEVVCGKQVLILRSMAGRTNSNATAQSASSSLQQGSYDNTNLSDTLVLSKTGFYSRIMPINGSADTIPAITLYRTSALRPVVIKGRFPLGPEGELIATMWHDSLNPIDSIIDTLSTVIPWNSDSSGAYSGTVYMHAHVPSNIQLVVGNASSPRIGYAYTAVDTLVGVLTLNCRSSIPVVTLRADTSLGWGDTLRLHANAIDSVDTINQYSWNMNGSSFNVASLSDTSVVIPMLTDSLYTCSLMATDNSGNSASDKIQATMTCSVRNFRITNTEMPGWTQTSYGLFEGARIANVLDSVAATVKSSVKGAIQQAMIQTASGVSRAMNAVIMDCSTRSQAKSLYAAYKNRIAANALVACPPYADSAAVIDNSLSDGGIVYACFKRFVIVVQLRGFIDYTTMLANASRFTSVYEQRTIKTSICRNE